MPGIKDGVELTKRLIQRHKHSGDDSPQIDYNDLLNKPGGTGGGDMYESTWASVINGKTTLGAVKVDSDISDTITKKHSNTLDHSNSLDHTNVPINHDNTYHTSGYAVNTHVHTGVYASNTDGRLADARTPVTHNNDYHTDGYAVNTHTHTGTYASNTDSRLADAREPVTHNDTYHVNGYAVNTHNHTGTYASNTDGRLADTRTPVVHNDTYHVNSYPTNVSFASHITNAVAHSGGGADPWTYLTLTSEFRTPLSAAVNVTGLSFTPSANLKYEIEGSFYVKTDTATVSPQPGCAFPTGMVRGVAQVVVTVTNATTILGLGHLGDNIKAIGTGLPVITNYYPASLWAIMTAGATPTGIFRVTLASETNATNVYMGIDSFLKYRTYV